MSGSVRDYAVLYLRPKGAPGASSAGGGNVVLSGGGAHALDGPEHTAAGDATRLDASSTAHGLLPKLSGAATDVLLGDGTWGEAGASAYADLTDVDVTGVGDGDMMVWDTGTSTWVPAAPGGGSALTVADEGTPLATDATTLDFVGAGVAASGTGATKTITISGGVEEITDVPTAETDTALVLHPDGAGGIEWGTDATGAGGGLVLLEHLEASSSASLDFASTISATYDEYVFEIVNLLSATNTVQLYMRLSTDGGSTYDTSTIYTTQRLYNYAAIHNVEANAGVGYFGVGGAGVDNTHVGFNGRLRLFSPGAAVYKTVMFDDVRWVASGLNTIVHDVGGGQYASTTAVNAVHFLFSSGNIASGGIRSYGVAKT